MKALGFLPIILVSICLLTSSASYAKALRELNESEVNKLKANIEKNPENMVSRRFLALHYFEKKNWVQVTRHLAPVAENLPTPLLRILAKSYVNLGNIRQAETIIRIPLSAKTVSPESYLLAAEVYAAKGRSSTINVVSQPAKDLLFETLKTAQLAYPNNYLIYETRINYLEEFVPHYQYEALKVLEDMTKNKLKFKPKHYSMVCKFNHLSGFTKQTTTSCLEAIEKDPSTPGNYIYLGQTHINIGEKEKGMRVLASVGEKFSDSEEALWATADAYYSNKNLPEAFNYFKKATNHPDVKPRDFLGFAKVAFDLKKYDVALMAFDKHCSMTETLDHEFRRASGLLKSPLWKARFRRKMMNCQKK